MNTLRTQTNQRGPESRIARQKTARPKARPRKMIDSLGLLYAHALAIEHEARARYLELAAHMADYGNDTVAELFARLAEFEAEHAFLLAKKSLGVEIPLLEPDQYAWLDCGPPLPEARAFVYRMMTPRLALQIALQAEERGKAFYEHVCATTRRADVRALAMEFAQDETAHVSWVMEALEHLPQPFKPDEARPGDPTIEQRI